MKCTNRLGFTLIELLTVIAIIAILAGLTAVAVPRALEAAKVARVDADLNQLQVALTGYYSEHNSYPPGYGYFLTKPVPEDQGNLGDGRFYALEPWYIKLGLSLSEGVIDQFADSHDTNQDGMLGQLEFMPLGNRLANQVNYPNELYNGGNLQNEVQRQISEDRPYVYVPINTNDFRKVRGYYNNTNASDAEILQRQRAQIWDVNHQNLSGIGAGAPPNYDAFALVSVGPFGNTAGLLTSFDPVSGGAINNPYYITGLRSFFLLSRDANGNGLLDFDYRSRTRSDEGAIGAYPGWPQGSQDNHMGMVPGGPNGAPGPSNLPGPMIKVVGVDASVDTNLSN